MNAALEACGDEGNLFHQGVAKEPDNSDVIAATIGEIVRSPQAPAGSNGRLNGPLFQPSSDPLGVAAEIRRVTKRYRADRRLDPQNIIDEDRPRVLAAIQNAIRTKSLFELEHRVHLTNGSIGWMLSRAGATDDGNKYPA